MNGNHPPPGTSPTTAPGTPKSLLRSRIPIVLLSVVLPFVTYSVLTARGVDEVTALLLIGVWPLIELVVFFTTHRRIDEFAVVVLVFFGLGALSMVAFNSPYLILVKDSAITGLFGLVLLTSLLLRRPLMFHFGRKFGTDGSASGIAHWNGLWQHERFRRAQRTLTAVWGMAFVAEAAVRIALAAVLPVPVSVIVSNVLPLLVIAALGSWTIAHGKHARASARKTRNPQDRAPVPTSPAESPRTPN